MPPYRAAMKAGILTAMESYNEISGVPMVSSREYLKEVRLSECLETGSTVVMTS